MKCTNHPEIEANGICVKCGKLMCKDCLVDVGGKNHCKACLKKTFNLNEAPVVVVNNSNSNSNSNNSGGWGFGVCCCIIIIILVLSGV